MITLLLVNELEWTLKSGREQLKLVDQKTSSCGFDFSAKPVKRPQAFSIFGASELFPGEESSRHLIGWCDK